MDARMRKIIKEIIEIMDDDSVPDRAISELK
jgi:hypothetical protein